MTRHDLIFQQVHLVRIHRLILKGRARNRAAMERANEVVERDGIEAGFLQFMDEVAPGWRRKR